MEALQMAYMTEINTSEFQFSHGRLPKGRGSWLFDMIRQGEKVETYWARADDGQMSMTYAQARRLALYRAEKIRASRINVCA
jgi:hypothetical protein